jgi:hypothetical protein
MDHSCCICLASALSQALINDKYQWLCASCQKRIKQQTEQQLARQREHRIRAKENKRADLRML